MDTHDFASDQRVRRFPIAIVGEDRLWYQSIHPFLGNWEALQERLRTQFSNTGNTKEQLFHVCRPFHFDINAVVTDVNVQGIRQELKYLIIVNHQFQKYLKTLCHHICTGYYSKLRT